jgi:hypothetical protein
MHTSQVADEQVVILSQVLSHEVNMGYQTMTDSQVTHVNKEKVVNLKQFTDVVDAAVQAHLDSKVTAESDSAPAAAAVEERQKEEGESSAVASVSAAHLVLDMQDGRVVVLDIAAALAVHEELLEQNRVPSDRSSDLADTPDATVVEEAGADSA